MIGIASDDRKPQPGFQGRGIAAPAPIAPPKEEPSIASQFATQAMNRGIDTAVTKGGEIASKYLTPAAAVAPPTQAAIAANAATTGTAPALMQSVMGAPAATGAVGAGGMAALGTAVPYIGAGLVAGKALGLFSEGSKGPVGFNPYLSEALKQEENDFNKSRPLRTESASNTSSVRTAGPLSKIKYKSAGGEVYELSYGGGPLKGQENSMRLKSFSQKDRYGNMTSFEFFEPDDSIPMLIAIPEPDGYNGADTSNHPGEPRGTDTVPAWLTPGENVVNAEASRIPGNQEKIDQMNEEGRKIQKAQGGPIPTYAANGKKIEERKMKDGRIGLFQGNTFLGIAKESSSPLSKISDAAKELNWNPFNSQGGEVPPMYAANGIEIDDDLLNAIREVESGGDDSAISRVGAAGPYQIMAETALKPGYDVTPISLEDRFNPTKSREFARQYLEGIAAANPEFTRDEVITAYHSGAGNVAKGNLGPQGQAYASKVNAAEEDVDVGAQIKRAFMYPLEVFGLPVDDDAPGVPNTLFGSGTGKDNSSFDVKADENNLKIAQDALAVLDERKAQGKPVNEKTYQGAKDAVEYQNKLVTANQVITETDTGDEPDQPAPDENTNKQVVDAGLQKQNEDPGFFKEVTGLFKDVLGDMFSPEDITRMVINYAGSRMLGYEHNGSLNYAMKDYVTRTKLQDKREYELVKANKDNYTTDSFNKYIRSGNVEDLVAKSVGIKKTSGSTYLRGSGIIPTVTLTDGSEGVLIGGQPYSVSTVIDQQGTTIADIMEPVDKDIHSVQAVRKRLDNVAEDARSAANRDVGLEDEKGLSDDTQAIAMQAASKFNKILLRNGASIAQSEDLEIAVNGAIQDYYTARAIAKRDGTTAPTSVEGFVEARLITPLTNDQISMDMIRGTSAKNLRALNKQIYNDMEIKDKRNPLFQREYADEWTATKNAWQLLSTEERADWTRKASKRDDYSAFTLWMSKTPAKEIDRILKEQSN